MNKSKKFKTLLVLGMSIATATSLVSATACNVSITPNVHTHNYEWVTTDANQHWKECTADGHTGDKIDQTTKGDHVYDNDQDTTCNTCGHVREVAPKHEHKYEWVTTDENQHWKECTAEGHTGDKIDPDNPKANHVYDNDDDTTCNTCGHVRELPHKHNFEWVNTEDNEHWKECADDLEEEAGTRGAHTDANHDNVCDDCGYEGGTLPQGFTDLLGKTGTEAVVEDTFLQTRKLTEFSEWGTAGVYTAHNSKGTAEGNYTEVKDGKALMTDTTNGATNTIVDFGGAVGSIEGYFEMTFENVGNSWTPVQFYSAANKEFFGLRTDGGLVKYRLNGGSAVASTTEVASADLTAYSVYFKYNYETKKFTMTVNGNAFAEVDVTIDGISGVKFVSSDSNYRIVNIDNLVVVNTPAPFALYKAELDAKVEADYTAVPQGQISAAVKEQLNAAYAAYNTASAAATNNAEIKAAYDTFEAAFLAGVRTELKAQFVAECPATDYTVNKDKYDKIVADFDAALAKADSFNACINAIEAAFEAIDKVENDVQAAIADITVEVKNAEGTVVGSITVKAGVSVQKADLDDEITIPTGQRVAGYYSEPAFTTAVTLPIDTTGEAEDKTITIYVKFEDIPSSEIVTHTLDIAQISGTKLTEETLINDIFYGTVNVKSESAKMNSGTYEKQVSLTGGAATTAKNSIKFTIEKDAVVTVVVGANNHETKKDAKLVVLGTDGKNAAVSDITLNGVASEFQILPVSTSDKTAEIAVTYSFKLPAGTYYLGDDKGLAFIFALSVAEGA